jgi:hypothetical protein
LNFWRFGKTACIIRIQYRVVAFVIFRKLVIFICHYEFKRFWVLYLAIDMNFLHNHSFLLELLECFIWNTNFEEFVRNLQKCSTSTWWTNIWTNFSMSYFAPKLEFRFKVHFLVQFSWFCIKMCYNLCHGMLGSRPT